MLRISPYLTIGLVIGPIVAGLLGTILPALGFLPALGRHGFTLAAWYELFATPGLSQSVALTIFVGFSATIFSTLLATCIVAVATCHGSPHRLVRFVTPILAVPHVAVAVGFAFLILPSGWFVRVVSQVLTGWSRPPELITVHDPYGLALIAGLALKELPFLILMIFSALNQIPYRHLLVSASALGYPTGKAWLVGILPRLYPQIRLPIFAVLVFSISAIDVSIVLGPGLPPPLSVLALRWFTDYDLFLYPRAAAASLLQFLIAISSIAIWIAVEAKIGRAFYRAIYHGKRIGLAEVVVWGSASLAVLSLIIAIGSIAALITWSVSADWVFPAIFPSGLEFTTWHSQLSQISAPAVATGAIGISTTCIAVVLSLACLENEQQRRSFHGTAPTTLVYFPLLVPQISFVFGLQVWLVTFGFDGTYAAVAWSHLIFVLPYVFLSLSDPFRALDARYVRAGASLGTSPYAAFFRIKLPLVLKPVVIAFSTGFAVSVSMYAPTLFAGSGRIATLTTEAVTLSGSADRRVLGVYGSLQALMPALVYGIAYAIPLLAFRNRRGLD